MVNVARSYCDKCKQRVKQGEKLVHRSEPKFAMKRCECGTWFTPRNGAQKSCNEHMKKKKESHMPRFTWTKELIEEGREQIRLKEPKTKAEALRLLEEYFLRPVTWPCLYKFTEGFEFKSRRRNEKGTEKMGTVEDDIKPHLSYVNVVEAINGIDDIPQLENLRTVIDAREKALEPVIRERLSALNAKIEELMTESAKLEALLKK
jgi:hypothetical protein